MEEKVSLISGIFNRTEKSIIKSLLFWPPIVLSALIVVAAYITPVFGLEGGTRLIEPGTMPKAGEYVLVSPGGANIAHIIQQVIPNNNVDKREYLVVGRAGATISPCGEFVCSKMGASKPVTIKIPSSLVKGSVSVDHGNVAVYDMKSKEIVNAKESQVVGRIVAVTDEKIPGLFGLYSWVNDAHWLTDETSISSAVRQSVNNLSSLGDVLSQSGKGDEK